jgi:hypothetical protein
LGTQIEAMACLRWTVLTRAIVTSAAPRANAHSGGMTFYSSRWGMTCNACHRGGAAPEVPLEARRRPSKRARPSRFASRSRVARS